MSDVLEHHGILGQKWGVRRTPAQLGHPTSGNGSGSNKQGSSAASTNDSKKTPGKSFEKPRAMTDEELRQRINRLNMEEQYANLLARQKERNKGGVKKALSYAFEKFGVGVLDRTVTMALNAMFDKKDKSNEKDKFDINDWKNKGVNDMDFDTIQKVSKWYESAQKISRNRETLSE